MTSHSILAMAVATRRVGFVYLIERQIQNWMVSHKASMSPLHAVEVAQKWINDYEPSVVVTEKITTSCRKSQRTKDIIQALARNAANNYLLDIAVERRQLFANKYDEAAALTADFPELLPSMPVKRKFYDPEPRNTVLFEALALALQVIDNSPKPSHIA